MQESRMHWVNALSESVCIRSFFSVFWIVFSRIRTKYGEIFHISPYSVQMRANTDQNNSKYGHFFTQWRPLRVFSYTQVLIFKLSRLVKRFFLSDLLEKQWQSTVYCFVNIILKGHVIIIGNKLSLFPSIVLSGYQIFEFGWMYLMLV